MAKLHKRPPAAMNPVAQVYSPGTSQAHSSYSQDGWSIWYPNPPSNVQKDVCPSSSFVSRTMSCAKGHLSPPRNSHSYTEKSRYSNDATQLTRRSANVAVASSNTNPYASLGSNPSYQSHGLYDSAISYESAPEPRTEGERYWAYRAIVAEVKLAERMGVRADELERMKEELRKRSAAGVPSYYYEERVQRLEKLALGLISTIVLITLILLFRHHSSSDDRHPKNRSFRPHLTIPILSPFTSIVEHEDSSFSFRTTAVFLIVLGCAAFAMFRYWLRQRQR